MNPVAVTELENGVEARFGDGAVIRLTLDGVSECSLCAVSGCRHMRGALSHYSRRKWQILEARRMEWAPGMYRQLNVDPMIFFRPDEMDYFPLTGGDVIPEGEEFVLLQVYGGTLATFRDGGHVWICKRHPEGSTRCLKCGVRRCEHYVRAIEAIAERQAHLCPPVDGGSGGARHAVPVRGEAE